MANTSVGEKDDSGGRQGDYVEVNERVESPPGEKKPVLTVGDGIQSSIKETRVLAQAETPIPDPKNPVQETPPSRTQEVELNDPSEATRIECDSPFTRPRDSHQVSPEANPIPNPRQHTTALTEPTSPHDSPPHTRLETNSIESGTPGRIQTHILTTDTETETDTQETILDTAENTELYNQAHTLTTSYYHSKFYPSDLNIHSSTTPTHPPITPPKSPIHVQSEDIKLAQNPKKTASPIYIKPPIVCGTDTKLMPNGSDMSIHSNCNMAKGIEGLGSTRGDSSIEVRKVYTIEENIGNFEYGGVGVKRVERDCVGKPGRITSGVAKDRNWDQVGPAGLPNNSKRLGARNVTSGYGKKDARRVVVRPEPGSLGGVYENDSLVVNKKKSFKPNVIPDRVETVNLFKVRQPLENLGGFDRPSIPIFSQGVLFKMGINQASQVSIHDGSRETFPQGTVTGLDGDRSNMNEIVISTLQKKNTGPHAHRRTSNSQSERPKTKPTASIKAELHNCNGQKFSSKNLSETAKNFHRTPGSTDRDPTDHQTQNSLQEIIDKDLGETRPTNARIQPNIQQVSTDTLPKEIRERFLDLPQNIQQHYSHFMDINIVNKGQQGRLNISSVENNHKTAP